MGSGGIVAAGFDEIMTWRAVRLSLTLLIALVLVYYSVAWAVLRCCHDDHPAHELMAADSAESGSHYHSMPSESWIDCLNPDYRAETLAASSLTSQARSLFDQVLLHGIDFHTRPIDERPATQAHGLGVWARVAGYFYSTDSPRFLTLSVLRI